MDKESDEHLTNRGMSVEIRGGLRCRGGRASSESDMCLEGVEHKHGDVSDWHPLSLRRSPRL